MRYFVLLFSLLLLVGCSAPENMDAQNNYPEHYNEDLVYPKILGGEEFTRDIKIAITIIYESSPETYLEIKDNIVSILYNSNLPAGAGALAAPTMRNIHISAGLYSDVVNNPQLNKSPQFLLSRILVHELTHIKDYFATEEYSELELEKRAISFERQLLRALGVDEEMVQEIAGEHRLEKYGFK